MDGREPGGHGFVDASAGQVVRWGAVREMDRPAILALRLDAAGDGIAEIETLVVRQGCPIFDPQAMAVPQRTHDEVLEPSRRPSRRELIRAANLYLDGIERDQPGIIPVRDDRLRIENGVPTTLQPGDEHDPRRLGMAEQVARATPVTSRPPATDGSRWWTRNGAWCSATPSSTTPGTWPRWAAACPAAIPTA